MSCRTKCCMTFVFVLALVVVAVPAFAGSADPTLCLQTQFNQVQKQKLNCSANDVRVASVSNVTDLSGNTISTCTEGSTFSFIANFHIVTTANAVNSGGRDNIGLYFQTDPAKTDALNGNTCTDDIIAPNHPCDTSAPANAATCGAGTGYKEFDASPDNCGDTSSSVNANITDTILVKDFKCTTSNSVPCPFDSTKQCLSLPNCTSWQVPGSSILCQTSAPLYPFPFDGSGNPEAIPGSPSKCNCGVVALPVQPVNPQPLALKACNTPITGTAPTFNFSTNSPPGTVSPSADTNCDAGVEGVGTATYTVAIDNPNSSGTTGDIIVDQICDSAYGQVYPLPTSLGGPGGSCKAGTTGAITGTTCSALDIPLDSAPGTFDNFKTCTFTAPSIGELNTVTDVVTVSGHSKVNNTVTWTAQGTNSVMVHSEDATSTGAAVKSYKATIAACATVTYGVEVDNTSGTAGVCDTVTTHQCTSGGKVGAACTTNADCPASNDEVETLSALSDSSFGSLTSVHDNVLRTDCSVTQTIPVGGSYKCTFDAQFCSGVDTNTCIHHDNQITTVTLVADENGDTAFNSTSNTLRVQECLTPSTPAIP